MNRNFVVRNNADPNIVADKLRRIREPHVRAVNNLADRIADAEGLAHGLVPYTDPDLGGIYARALVLLDNPSSRAEAGRGGSGMLSPENDDTTAANCVKEYLSAGITPDQVIHWNVAPAPVKNTNGSSSAAERSRGAMWLRELLGLMPDLDYVLLLGRKAEDGWKRAVNTGMEVQPHVLVTHDVPHCSARGLNGHRGEVHRRDYFRQSIAEMADHLRR